jgi:type IV secretory pathway TrbF-like protein
MATNTATPYDRARDHYGRIVGLGKGVTHGLAAAAVVSSLTAAAMGAWAVHEARQGAGRIERHIVRIDPQGAVVGELRVDETWRPSDGDLIGFATRWITNLRARPLDEVALRRQRLDLRDTSDQRVWNAIGEILKRADEEHGNRAVDVESVAANIFARERNGTALVSVRWTERVRGTNAKPVAWSAPLVLAYKEPTTTAEFGRNPVGIYVVDFQNIQVEAVP